MQVCAENNSNQRLGLDGNPEVEKKPLCPRLTTAKDSCRKANDIEEINSKMLKNTSNQIWDNAVRCAGVALSLCCQGKSLGKVHMALAWGMCGAARWRCGVIALLGEKIGKSWHGVGLGHVWCGALALRCV